MRLLFGVFITLTLLTTAQGALAQAYRRDVSFEFEEVPNAKSYDVEIRSVGKDGVPGKAMSFKTKEAIWSGKLVPGKYTMSLRSRDIRGVPGDWSPPEEFNVNLDPVKIKSPTAKAQIKASEEDAVTQKFEWEPVNGANEYRFELSSDDGKTQIVETVKEAKYNVKIPVAKNYTWKITGLGQNEMQSDSVTVSNFSVIGKKIAAPEITSPESEFVRDVKWSRPDNVDKFDLTLSRINPASKRWEKVLVQENVTDDTFHFDEKHPGGTYRLEVKAKGAMRGDSDTAKMSFKVIHGDRSPAAEYTALVRKSIDRLTGWYGVTSYLVTQVNYQGETLENNARTKNNILGGTGRVGAGYFSPNEKWGFLGIVDMSGFIMDGSNHTYASMELNGIRRYVVGDLGEARLIYGLYYKEIPQLIGTPVVGTNGTVEFSQTAVVGPHLGAEYWHSLSPKIGFQVNAHTYYNVITMKTPNGNPTDPRLSYQLGFMGSYRFSNRFTGLMGLTQKMDQVAYKANKTGSTTEAPGDFNTTQITGQYLSFFAEYGF
jgi:hypothetical protein